MSLRMYLALLFFGFIVFVFSCKKDEGAQPVDFSFLIHKWKVLSIAEQTTLENANGNYFIEFVADGGYSLGLDTKVDLNSCFGEYNVPEKEKIFFKFIGCTKVCCDSDYAKS